SDDSPRVLVDRLWPRNVTHAQANITAWLKDVAPSNQLRKWWSHDIDKWEDFKEKYMEELNSEPRTIDATETLRVLLAQHGKITLVYGAKDEEHNNAVVLREFLGGEV